MSHLHERLRYRLITGLDDSEFCQRVSRLLDEGYELYGSPAITYNGTRAIVAQALVLPPYEAVRFRGTAAASPVEADPPEPAMPPGTPPSTAYPPPSGAPPSP